MTDSDSFEARLQEALLRYADGPVGVDAAALAGVIAAGTRRGQHRTLVPGLGDARPMWRLAFAVTLALLVALVGGVLLVGSGLVRPKPPVLPRTGSNGLIAFCIGEWPATRVHLIDSDGSNDRDLVGGTGAVFSADGSALTYVTGWPDDTTVIVTDADGSNPRQVPDIGGANGGQEHALSPDGKVMAWFDRRRPDGRGGSVFGFEHPSIRITPLDDGPVRQLTTGSEIAEPYATGLTWAPDGRSIAVAGLREQGGVYYRSSIYIVDVPSGNVRRLTARLGPDDVSMAWAPDSRRLAFTALPAGAAVATLASSGNVDYGIAVIDVDGTHERDVADGPFIERDPAWSPDGERIAYLAWDGSATRITISGPVGSGSAPQAVAGPAAARAIWSPDGSTILYLSGLVISTIDSGFRQPPATLASGIGLSDCASWQRAGS